MPLSKAEQALFEQLLARNQKDKECPVLVLAPLRSTPLRSYEGQDAASASPPTLPPGILPHPGIGSGWLEPEDDEVENLWLRWDPTDFIRVRITSREPSNYVGHWVSGIKAYRDCTAPTCPFCPRPGVPPIASKPRQRHLLAVELENGCQRIWEFSPKVAARLRLLLCQPEPRPLRGLVLILGREGRRKNGECCCRVDDDQGGGVVPEPLDVAGELALTWRRAAIRDAKFGRGERAEGDDGPLSF